MSLFFCSLNSGSNGNCYYVGNHSDAVLVDIGLSCKETELRLQRLGLTAERIRGIFISHEHIDHIKGVQVFAKRYQIPVYCNPATLRHSGLKVPEHLLRLLHDESPVELGNLRIYPFAKQHDAAEPISFTIEFSGARVAVITDIGHVCKNVLQHFSNCHAAILEANYEEEMLFNGHYPAALKKRISGKKGHLSNADALELFVKHRSPTMSHLVLAHLSKENNHPELLRQHFAAFTDTITFDIASRYEESKLYELSLPVKALPILTKKVNKQVQLSLF